MSLDLSSFLLHHHPPTGTATTTFASTSASPQNRYNRTLTQDWELEAALRGSDDADADDWVDEPETKEFLKSINPDNWKKQDHYAILGITRLRWKATDADIKTATVARQEGCCLWPHQRRCLLQVSPKAWEVITDPKKRREFDSCDPTFDDALPLTVKKGQNFYAVFGPAFEKEARFSKDPEIFNHKLGDDSSSREEVEAFYRQWINFDSWRTFEFMDEEEEGLDDSREAKRWLDKKNRANRSKLKKEDNQRVIKFIEAAMKLDPRLQKYKEEEKIARDLKKNAAKYAAEKEAAEKKKAEEEAAAAAAIAAAEEKAKKDVSKKEKEAQKKLARKARNAVRAIFAEHNSFLAAGAKPSDIEDQQAKFDTLLEALDLLQLEEFKGRLDAKVSGGAAALNEVLDAEIALAKK
ncbi:hypothetical protein BCR33DRAFT_741472 [Rhizoclosmatium globosum]|uniref:J domain-containing protein n=1 Tax=Rhizoclosmatium globosum TaxID=329046 RepID=A0A1Y2BV24_9FUNG|nr:hypothetical protein BCR33DRAFT_741472 [Rhizoclosmatium globosum]|eukprot:ORY38610.1 hypothetical protein BCR33DRAFT_741472 [Rhizoclosmatium globosum]